MIKKTVKYLDFDGAEQTEDVYFHISKSELVERELSTEGSWSGKLKNLVAEQNPTELVAQYKDLMGMAYGVRSEDGRRFIKSDELRAQFFQSLAFEVVFSELMTNPETALELVKGMVPADMLEPEEVQKEVRKVEMLTQPHPSPIDLENMSADELRRMLASQTKL